MRLFDMLRLRARSLFARARVERELEAEFAFHRERDGRGGPATGDGAKEACRDRRGLRLWDDLRQDAGYAARAFQREPAFVAAVVLILALGIGANTAMFSVVDAVLLRPLPYPHPEQLVQVSMHSRAIIGEMVPADYLEVRGQARSFQGIALVKARDATLTVGGDSFDLVVASITSSLLPLLGVRPALGRNLFPIESTPGHEHEVLLSDALWHRQFRADPGVIGRALGINGQAFTVIGVMPPGFGGPDGVDLGNPNGAWIPEVFAGAEVAEHASPGSSAVYARLKPGVALSQARAELTHMGATLGQQYHTGLVGFLASSVNEDAREGDYRSLVWLLFGAVGLVLLIACANVANLLLARGARRRHEMAIRRALGAAAGRIFRQLLTEGLMLALAGGALGLLVASALIAWAHRGPDDIPRLAEASLDHNVLAFTLAAAVLCGVLFSLAPAWQSSRRSVGVSLKPGPHATPAHAGAKGGLRSLLLVGEIALALVLLVGAGLLIKSFARLTTVNPALDTQNVMALHLEVTRAQMAAPGVRAQLAQRLLSRVRALPGVRSAAVAGAAPFDDRGSALLFTVLDHPTDVQIPVARSRRVTPDYFATLGIRLVRGRLISEADTAAAPRVLVVNQAWVRRYWPRGNPIGGVLEYSLRNDGQPPIVQATIVGIVSDARDWSLDQKPVSEIYEPYVQAPSGLALIVRTGLALIVKTDGTTAGVLAAVRTAATAAVPEAPVEDASSLDQIIAASVAAPRFRLLLLGLFAGLALAFALAGIYGLVAYTVGQRTRELGIRIALGASRGGILRLVLGQGLGLTLAGVAIGLAGAAMATRLLGAFLFEVQPTDMATYATVAMLFIAVALLAAYLPARRAAEMDPVAALRCE